MDFRIHGLDVTEFRPLFALSDAELARRQIVRMRADRQPGYPCRVSLRDAEPGDAVLLLNYEHLPVASPYRSRHAIYVRQDATGAALAVNEVPSMLRLRLLSVRAFDAAGMMRAADVVAGTALEAAIADMLADGSAEYLHIHNAKHGCYAARVVRA
jgi:hypothetical protein